MWKWLRGWLRAFIVWQKEDEWRQLKSVCIKFEIRFYLLMYRMPAISETWHNYKSRFQRLQNASDSFVSAGRQNSLWMQKERFQSNAFR